MDTAKDCHVVRVHVGVECVFFFSSRRRHTRSDRDWSSDVCSSDLTLLKRAYARGRGVRHVAGAGGPVRPLLQDQTQVAWACLAAYDASLSNRRYLAIAEDLVAVLERDFSDSTGGGYFDVAASDPAAPALADRAKPVLDELLPGANAWLARVLLRLAEATQDARYRRRAEATLEAFAGAVAGEAMRASTYLAAAQHALAAR